MSVARLARLKPINSLSGPLREKLLADVRNEVFAKKVQLDAGEEKDWYLYLLDGQITVQADSGDSEKFNASSQRAMKPIFTNPKLTEKAVVHSDCRIARVDRLRYQTLREKQANGEGEGYEVNAADAVAMEADVLKRLFDDYQKGTIPVPTFPEAALRVRKLMKHPDATVMHLAKYVEQDPALAGKVVASSNSAATGGQSTIVSVKDALVRLGMKPAGNLISSLAMKELFDFPNAKLKQTAQEVWRHSVLVGASARALVGAYGKDIDGDKAFLVGLLHDIGAVALLAYFDKHQPDSSEFMPGGELHEMCTMVSGMVVEKWDLDSDFVQSAETAGQWDSAGSDNQYAAFTNLAKQQVHLMHETGISVPAIEELAAYKALNPVVEDGVIPILKDNKSIQSTIAALG